MSDGKTSRRKGLYLLTFLARLKELKDRCMNNLILDLAAQLAYYFLLSFFPFLLLTVTFLAYLPIGSESILELIKPFTPPDSYHLIEMNVSRVLDVQRGDILSISLISTIYLASLAFQSIIRSLNNAYQVEQKRPLWKNLILGFFLMAGLFTALLISLILPVFGEWIGDFLFFWFGLEDWFPLIWSWIRWLLSSMVLFLFFLCLYKYVPNIPIRFIQALPGALFSVIGWQFSSLVFSSYVNLNHYSIIYGNLGGVVILVGWFYVTAFVLILGGQINAVWGIKS